MYVAVHVVGWFDTCLHGVQQVYATHVIFQAKQAFQLVSRRLALVKTVAVTCDKSSAVRLFA